MDSCEAFVNGIERFENSVNNKHGGCIVKIVRKKNMFSRFKELELGKNSDDKIYQYADVKYNVIISLHNVSIVGEIQFLLLPFLRAKQMGHSLYGVKRRDDYVSNINTLSVMQSDRRAQILAAMTNQDVQTLSNELLYDPEFAFAISDVDHNPLLLYSLFYGWYKGFKLILSTLMHLDKLQSKSETYKISVKNSSNRNARDILHNRMFHGFGHPLFGLSWKTLLDHPNNQTKMIIEILKCPLLDVNAGNGYILWHACQKGIYFIVDILLKYRKNELKLDLYNCGITPLMAVCETSATTFATQRLINSLNIVRLMVEKSDVDLTAKSKEFEGGQQAIVVTYDERPSFPAKQMAPPGKTALDIIQSAKAKNKNRYVLEITKLLKECLDATDAKNAKVSQTATKPQKPKE